MARNFVASQIITFPVPAALVGVDGGPLTIVSVYKLNSSTYNVPIFTKTSAANAWWVEIDTTGGLHANYGTGTTPRNVGTVTTGAYMVGIFRKDASGSFQPVGRFLTGAGFTTDSGNITAVSTLIDGPALDSGGLLQFGRWGATDYSTDFDLAATAVWNSYVVDGTVTGFTSWTNILAASPTYWAKFDSSNVTDSASQTPTITGATVVSDPSGFFGAADQNITASGIVTGAAVGNSTVSATYTINANGIPDTAAVGSPSVTVITSINANGITTTERLGSPTLSTTATINANGITSSERLGTATTSLTVVVNGIVSSERVGTATISLTVNAAGIITCAKFGAPTVQRGSVTINASGISSSERLGNSVTSQPVTQNIAASGIVSSEAFGSSVTILAQSINANGIAGLEAFGAPSVTPSAVTINAGGISTTESFGNAQLGVSITPAGIPSAESFGATAITVTAAGISAGNITSNERFGSPSITTTVTIAVGGIRSEQQIGNSLLYRQLSPGGISSTEKIGSPAFSVGPATINARGINSQEAFGRPIITAIPLVAPTPNTLIRLRIGQTVLSNEVGQSTIRLNDAETLITI